MCRAEIAAEVINLAVFAEQIAKTRRNSGQLEVRLEEPTAADVLA
jgi:hypothetical protein